MKKKIVVKNNFCYSCRRGLRRRQAEPDDADTESAQENNKVCRSVWKRLSHENQSVVFCSVADPGCLSRIPDPTFFHPGSELSSSRIRIEEFKYFNQKKWFLSSRKYDPGCSSRIRMLTFYPSRIPDSGVKKTPDPGSATLVFWILQINIDSS